MMHQGGNKEISGSARKVLKKDTVNVHKSNNKQDSSCVRDFVPKVLKIPPINGGTGPLQGDGGANGGKIASPPSLTPSDGKVNPPQLLETH